MGKDKSYQELLKENRKLRQENKQLRKEKSKLKITLNSIGDAVITTDTEGNVVHMNPVAEKLTGWTLNKACNQPITTVFNIISAKTRETAPNPVKRVLEAGEIVGLANHTTLISKDGSEYQIADSAAPIRDQQDHITGVVLVFRDITQKYKSRERLKQNKKELQEYKNRLEKTMEVGKVSWWEMDIQTGNVRFNQQKAKMLGYSPEKFSHYEDFMDLVHPEDYDRTMQAMRDHLDSKAVSYKADYRIQAKSGEFKWFHDTGGITKYDKVGKPEKVTGVVVDITQRKNTEIQLEQFFNINLDLLCITDFDGKFIKVNKEWEELLGYSAEELVEKNYLDFVHPDDLKKTKQAMANLRDKEKVVDFINRFESKEGSYRFIEWRSNPANNRVYVAARDITERLKTKEKLKLRTQAIDVSIDGIAILDENEEYLYLNQAHAEIYGYESPDKLMGSSWEILYDREETKRFKNEIMPELWKTGQWFGTAVGQKKDGSKFSQSISLTVLENGGLICVVRDITARKKIDENYKNVWESALDGMRLTDKNGVITKVNQAFCKMVGLDSDELEGQSISSIYQNDSEYIINKHRERFRNRSIPEKVVDKFHLHNGQIRWFEVVNSFVDFPGEDEQVLAIFRDVTEQKQIETALKRSKSRFKRLFEDLGDAVFVTQIRGQNNGKILEVNKAAVNQTGYSRKELLSMNIVADLTIASSSKVSLEYIKGQLSQGNKVSTIEKKIKKDGTEYWTEVVITPIDFNGKEACLSINRDITERIKAKQEKEKLQQQLLQTQKLESVGRLAGGVAHDMNNMLSPILGYGQMLQNLFEDDSREKKYIKNILKAGSSAQELVRQLLAFSRKQELKMEPVNLNKIIRGFEKLLQKTIHEDIDIRYTLEDSIPRIKGDKGQIEQIIMNLAVNAQDAMPDGGKLKIETGTKELDYQYSATNKDFEPGSFIYLKVSDTGGGMDKETQNKIFEPFFSTKGKDGTGMGLSTVYGIIKQHSGDITVESEINEGSTFTVYFPVHSKNKTKSKKDVKGIADNFEGQETILVAEDNQGTLELAEELLTNLGYSVIIAMNGQEALQKVIDQDIIIDLLITDIVMPGMNGKQLQKKLISKFPDMQTIFISGYTDKVISGYDLLDKDINFIRKPFDVNNLAGEIRDILDKS